MTRTAPPRKDGATVELAGSRTIAIESWLHAELVITHDSTPDVNGGNVVSECTSGYL